MKRFFHFLSVLFLISFIAGAAGCQKKGVDVKGQETELTGSWQGTGNALGHDRSYSCDNISLSFESDGSFQIKDVVQNSEIYSGTFTDQAGKLILNLNSGGSHLLPSGWVAASDRMELSYDMPAEDKLVLTCQNVSYFFVKDHMTFFWSGSPLLSMVENDVWYSDNLVPKGGKPEDPGQNPQNAPEGSSQNPQNVPEGSSQDSQRDPAGSSQQIQDGPGQAQEIEGPHETDPAQKKPQEKEMIPPPTEGDTTYILKLYDNYMEIYSLNEKKDNTVHFEANFFYLYSRDNTFSFYTLHKQGQNLPKVFYDLQDGISTINIDFYPSDDTLVLSSTAGSSNFYNNVMYGSSSNPEAMTALSLEATAVPKEETRQTLSTQSKPQ